MVNIAQQFAEYTFVLWLFSQMRDACVNAHFHLDDDDYVVSNNEKKDICYYKRKGGKNLKSTFVTQISFFSGFPHSRTEGLH